MESILSCHRVDGCLSARGVVSIHVKLIGGGVGGKSWQGGHQSNIVQQVLA